MKFPILVFFARALREQTRSILTYALRTFFVGILLFSLLYAYTMQFTNNAPGLSFLSGILYTNLVVISLLGLVYFATAITEEKEEMTLGLLQMSGLNPVSILLGKSTSRLFGVVFLLLVQVPLAVLAVTLGGVSIGQVWAAYATTMAYICLLCNIGLLFSVLAARGRTATAATAMCLLVFLICPKPCELLIEELAKQDHIRDGGVIHVLVGGLCESLFKTSPFTQMHAILSTGFNASPISYQVVASLVWGTLFFLVAWAVFDRRTREQKVSAPSRGMTTSQTGVLRKLGAGRSWARALAWKDFYFLAGGKTRIWIKAVSFPMLLVGSCIVYYASTTRMNVRPPSIEELVVNTTTTILVTVGLFTLLEAGMFASRFLGQEIKWKTLSSIALLPVPTSRLVGMKIQGIILTFTPNIVFLFICCCLISKDIVEFLTDLRGAQEVTIAMVVVLYVVVYYAFFLYLATLLSLFAKWGAFAMALVISLFTQYSIIAIFSIFFLLIRFTTRHMNMQIIMLTLACVTAVLCVVCHKLILIRLESVAGQAA